jgi:hypothetical protein
MTVPSNIAYRSFFRGETLVLTIKSADKCISIALGKVLGFYPLHLIILIKPLALIRKQNGELFVGDSYGQI